VPPVPTDPFLPPPAWSVAAFVMVIILVQAMLLFAVHRTWPGLKVTGGVAAAFVAVCVLTAGLASSGVLAQEGLPPRIMIYFAVSNLTCLGLALAPPGRALAGALPAGFWLVFQGFRLPLEGVLHVWAAAGTIPPQMSWGGENLDVISGLVCPALGALLWARPSARWAGWLGHAVGGALLVNVARVAALSAPTPFKAFEGPALLLPLHAPYTWIVPFAVGAALFTHVVGVRALLGRPGRGTERGGQLAGAE
jgi:hypothetical protein